MADHYKVGYRQPPLQTRFKKGQSGNPKGRPKKARTFHEALERALAKEIRVVLNGQPKKLTTVDAIAEKLTHMALKGEFRVMKCLLDAAAKTSRNDIEAEEQDDLEESDEALIARAIERLSAPTEEPSTADEEDDE